MANKNTKKKETITKDNKNSKNTKSINSKKDDNETVFKIMGFFDKYRLAIDGAIGGILVTSLVATIIWPQRIAKLENGKEPVASIDGYTITAEDLYEDMKKMYSVSPVLDKIDNEILIKKYPDSDEIKNEVREEAEGYYNMYKQYYNIDKDKFLSTNGFKNEAEFLEYLKLNNRRKKYAREYTKTLIDKKDIEKYYDNEVFGDINTKHILVKVAQDAKEEDKKKAEDLAKEIISKLNSGKSFDEVKEEYKDKITYEELGYKGYNSNLDPAYTEEMKKLSNNSYSKTPVKSYYGYHIVYRIDQKDKQELKDIEKDIINILIDKKLADDTKLPQKALKKLRNDNKIEFKDTVLKEKYDEYLDGLKLKD